MRKRKRNPTIYIVPEILEDIFLRLPLKSIIKCKTVSKQWRSILESKTFVERRMSLPKSRKILAAYKCDCGGRPSLLPAESRFQGDEEIVYMHFNAARPSMTCDGLVCFSESEWFNVLNPTTGQLRLFPSDPEPASFFLGWAMGFGRDKVTGSYKIVRMFVDPLEEEECDILDVESGEWRKLRLPPYVLGVGRNSVCVNGSIYWLYMGYGCKILALDLHKEEFHKVSVPSTWVTWETKIVNLEDRLAIALTTVEPEWILEICSMDAEEERWSKIYSITLGGQTFNSRESRLFTWFTPLTVSKLGNVVFYDNHKRLFKYYRETDKVCCLSSDICVISPYRENLVPLGSELEHDNPDYKIRTSRCRLHLKSGSRISKFLRKRVLEIVFTLVIGGCCGLVLTQSLKSF